MRMSYLLAGDIGGTKTVLGIYDPEKGPHEPLLTRTFASGSYPSLDAILEECLRETGYEISAGSFGVAGPVVGGRAATTNLPWQIDAAHLARRFRFSAVHLLNDLQATANAVPFLQPDRCTRSTAARPGRREP
jgi:glucokinase